MTCGLMLLTTHCPSYFYIGFYCVIFGNSLWYLITLRVTSPPTLCKYSLLCLCNWLVTPTLRLSAADIQLNSYRDVEHCVARVVPGSANNECWDRYLNSSVSLSLLSNTDSHSFSALNIFGCSMHCLQSALQELMASGCPLLCDQIRCQQLISLSHCKPFPHRVLCAWSIMFENKYEGKHQMKYARVF